MPVVLVPLVGLAAVLTFVVVYGMERGNRDWLVPLVNALKHPSGSFLKRTALKAAGFALAAVSFIVRYTTHYLSVAASFKLATFVKWIDGLTSWVTHVVESVPDLAADVEHALGRLVHNHIPVEIRKATAGLGQGIDKLWKAEHAAEQKLKAYAHGIDKLIHDKVMPKVRAAEHAISVTIPRDLAGIRHRVGDIAREIEHPSTKWLKRVATSMWLLALLGLMIRTLARRFPWLFCRKVKTVGNRVCGIDSDLLNELLFDTLLIAGTISLRDEIRAIQAITKPAIHGIEGFIREPL